MNTVYLSIGSNMGNHFTLIQKAIMSLSNYHEISVVAQSRMYETSPVGGVKQDDFMNAALKIQTNYTPYELLQVIHQIEKDLDRQRIVHWGPRTIDIDIIFFNEIEMNESNLIIPHQEAMNRLFVLVPLLEIFDNHFYLLKQVKESIEKLKETQQEIKVWEKDNDTKKNYQN